MSFLEPQIIHGRWISVDGPAGTEFIPADLVAEVPVYDGPVIPLPESLSPYCENRTVTEIKVVKGWGARFSMPGCLDATPWTLFSSEIEAQAYLEEQTDD